MPQFPDAHWPKPQTGSSSSRQRRQHDFPQPILPGNGTRDFLCAVPLSNCLSPLAHYDISSMAINTMCFTSHPRSRCSSNGPTQFEVFFHCSSTIHAKPGKNKDPFQGWQWFCFLNKCYQQAKGTVDADDGSLPKYIFMVWCSGVQVQMSQFWSSPVARIVIASRHRTMFCCCKCLLWFCGWSLDISSHSSQFPTFMGMGPQLNNRAPALNAEDLRFKPWQHLMVGLGKTRVWNLGELLPASTDNIKLDEPGVWCSKRQLHTIYAIRDTHATLCPRRPCKPHCWKLYSIWGLYLLWNILNCTNLKSKRICIVVFLKN